MIIALDAGHGINTSGKRCDKRFDPSQTREWWLNDRVVRYTTELLDEYDCTVIRCDDPTGIEDVTMKNRCKKANSGKADVLICVHHNGGGGKGVVVYRYKKSDVKTEELQKNIYNSVITANSNRGNRSNPMPENEFYMCKYSNMPCAYLENGFMDNAIDTPMIITDTYAKNTAQGIVNALIAWGKLGKKVIKIDPIPEVKLNPYTEPTINITKGSKGNNVKWVQWHLDRLGYDIGKYGIDGDFGNTTLIAVKKFQKAEKLDVDGIVGKASRSKLKI